MTVPVATNDLIHKRKEICNAFNFRLEFLRPHRRIRAADLPEQRRKARLDDALANPAMAPQIRMLDRELGRIGLDFESAANMATLNKALTEHRVDTSKRFALKIALSQCGIIS